MQLRVCPICNAKNLLPSELVDDKNIITMCENEHFVHFRVGILQYLAHTPTSEREERRMPSDDLTIHVERDTLVLN